MFFFVIKKCKSQIDKDEKWTRKHLLVRLFGSVWLMCVPMVISDGTKLRVLLVGEQMNERKEDPQMIAVIDVMEWN